MPVEPLVDEFRFADEPEPTWTHWISIHYELTDGSAFTLNVPDYSEDVSDEVIKDNATNIMQQNVFAPMGLSLVKIKGIEKIDTRKTPVTL